MPTTLTISALDVAFGARTLFTGLDLTVSDGDVTAVVGANGSGKSTLMRVLVGELTADTGGVRLVPSEASMAWLPQVVPTRDETLLDYARRRTGVAVADAALEGASDDLAQGSPGADDRYADALEHWLALGAADLAERLPEVAARVGLTVDPTRALGSLSGGEAARASLVALLLSRHDVLLLDEPTNDLDARGLGLVTEFVRGQPGPVLICSHDRAFLDRVATSVVELDPAQQRIGHYAGGWSDYAAARALERAQERAAYDAFAATRDSLVDQSRQRQDWGDRGRRAVRRGDEPDKHLRERDKARADRQLGKAARLRRAVDRLDEVEQPRKEWQLRYAITEGPPSAGVVASLDRAVVHRGAFTLGPVTVTLGRGDRVAVTGDNGSGKTTLLAALLGEVALASGRRSEGSRVQVGVLDQRRATLETDRSLTEVVRAETGVDDDGELRALLAKFGLGAEHVHRPSRSLSMGERTRAMMAVFSGRTVNVLVLDEPTNHLDVPAIEQLEQAVHDFTGTVLMVSHDEALLDAVGITHRWRVERGHVDFEAL
jgi:ATPase subunit of ABC transporter with duplicated ATPase domains